MNVLVFVLLTVAGAGIPIQVEANHKLVEAMKSPVLATAVAFLIGAIVMGLLSLTGLYGRGTLGNLGGLPWWAWIGGIISASVVLTSLIAVPKAGVGVVVAATVLGQMLSSVVIAHFGWLGAQKQPINVWRILGPALIFVGAVLMQKK